MYDNNFHNVKKQLIIDDIISFQDRFHIVLPDEIKEHYLRYNGGYPENYITFLSGSIREFIDSLVEYNEE